MALPTSESFATLRRRLDQLGYQHTLGIESLPLVERLFADLVHTTESLRKIKLDQSKQRDARLPDPKGQSVTFDPEHPPLEYYRADNAKLVAENNELHQTIIRLRDDFENNIKDMRANLRRNEHDASDLKFLNNQYVSKIQALEQESKLKSDRVLALQEKNLHAVIQTPTGRKKTIPFRRQRMEIDCMVPSSEYSCRTCKSASSVNSTTTDPYIADMLKVADDSIANLCAKVKVLTNEKLCLEAKLKTIKKQVECRDTEIDRMNGLLGTGRPRDAVVLENRISGNERLISHLNIQIDYLQQKVSDQNEEICDQKRKLNHRELNSHANEQLLVDIEQQSNDNRRLCADNQRLIAENNGFSEDINRLNSRLSEMNCVRDNLDTLLNKAQEEKKKFSLRINKLVCNERDLVMEVDRLKHRPSSKTTNRNKSVGSFDSYVKNVEQQKDYYKREVDALNAIIKAKSTPSMNAVNSRRTHTKATSPIRIKSRANSPSKSPKRSSSPKKNMARSVGSANDINRNVLPDNTKTIAHYEAIVKAMEEELNLYKQELHLFKAHKCNSNSSLKTSTNIEIEKLKNENSDLQDLLMKFERHMADIQVNVKTLTTERDSIKKLYNDVKHELQVSRKEVLQNTTNASKRTSLHAESMLRRLETEKDNAESELQRTNTERDTLRERLQIATDTMLNDRARLEQRIEDLRQSLHKRDLDNNNSLDENHKLRATLQSYEQKQVQSGKEVCEALGKVDDHLRTIDQMRSLMDQSERTMKDTDRQVQSLENALQQARKELSSRENETRQAKDDTAIQRRNLSALDKEKDLLQNCADELTREISTLRSDLDIKNGLIEKQREAVNELDQTISKMQEKIYDRDRNISSIQHQCDDLQNRLADACRGRDQAAMDNSRLHSDLETMVKENQNLSQDLHVMITSKDLLQQQLQDSISKNSYLDEKLKLKESERAEVIKKFGEFTAESAKFEAVNRTLDAQVKSQELDLNLKTNEINEIMKGLHHQESELNERKIIINEYSTQANLQAQKITSLGDQLNSAYQREHALGEDLASSRALAARLELDNEKANSAVTGNAMQMESMNNQINDLEAQNNNANKKILSEKQMIHELENVLAGNRDKEYQVQLSLQEKTSEVNALKDRVALNDSKLDRQHREITNLRTRNTELNTNVERLNRQLTNEQFEREKTIQVLKRKIASNNEFSLGELRSSDSARAMALMTRDNNSDDI